RRDAGRPRRRVGGPLCAVGARNGAGTTRSSPADPRQRVEGAGRGTTDRPLTRVRPRRRPSGADRGAPVRGARRRHLSRADPAAARVPPARRAQSRLHDRQPPRADARRRVGRGGRRLAGRRARLDPRLSAKPRSRNGRRAGCPRPDRRYVMHLVKAVLAAGCAAAVASALAPAATTTAELKVEKTKALGRVVADRRGHTLYLFRADHGRTSVCYGKCAVFWPPLLTAGKPIAGEGVKAFGAQWYALAPSGATIDRD